MPIIITSSVVRGPIQKLRRRPDPIHKLRRQTSRIVSLKNKAVREGIAKGMIDIVLFDLGIFSRTVARLSGKLRRAVEKAVRSVVLDKGFHTGKTVFTWEEIVSKILSYDTEEYFQYHIRSRGFYVNPTVKGTFPLRYSRFSRMARPSIRRNIQAKLKSFGIEKRVVFSV